MYSHAKQSHRKAFGKYDANAKTGKSGSEKKMGQTPEAAPADTDGAELNGGKQAFSTCGTTSLIILISDEYIICCNTGDSRAVLASEGASRPLSRDHKPENLQERRRYIDCP